MKRSFAVLTLILIVSTANIFAQNAFKDYKAGHVFYVKLPDYMSKTVGLNDAAIFQFKNAIKDVAGFIIEDNKEDLSLAQMNFSSITDFYESFINGFLTDQKKRTVSPPESKTIGDVKFLECDASYYDKETKSEIWYFVGIAETKDAYYKLLCFGSIESKSKFKSDFQKILYSIHD